MTELSAGAHVGPVDVCLLSMPYPPLDQASMALSLLRPALVAEGMSATVLYPCLWFAEEIGLKAYAFISDSKQEFLMGEWTFAGAAFPDFHPDHERYLDAVLAAPVTSGLALKHGFAADPRAALWHARGAATAFVERVAQRVLDLKPRIVGCTSTFMQHCASLAVLRRVRELDPTVVTVIGGANCEGMLGAAARKCFPFLDFVVSGEADLLFADLCRKLLAFGRHAPQEILPVGVIGGQHPCLSDCAAEPPRASVDEMDRTPVPDFDDYFSALAASPLGRHLDPGLSLETSRGCWWGKKHHCTFCGLNGGNMQFRSKHPDRVIAELDHLSRRYGIRKFNVVDNILDMSYIQTLLPRLATAEPYTLFYEAKSNLRRDQLAIMAAGGIRRLQPGLESLHDEILKLVDKGTTALLNVRLLKWSREIGIYITWNFLWDVPGERDEWYGEMADWLPAITHLQPPGVDRIQFHRFSPYHMRPERYGLALEPFPHYAAVYPVDGEDLRNVAYYFSDASRRPAQEELARRPGLRRALRTIALWKRLWGEGGGTAVTDAPPVLLIRDKTSHIEIEDTRPCATTSLHVLSEPASLVYRACDEIQTEATLMTSLRKHAAAAAMPPEEVRSVLDTLVSRRLVLRLNGRFIGLALRDAEALDDLAAEPADRATTAPGRAAAAQDSVVPA